MNAELVQLLRTILTQDVTADSQPEYRERTEDLHQAFFRLKERYGHAFPALGKLHFITAGAFPYSPDLTEALDVLQMSGTIYRQNPHFDRFGARYYEDLPEVAEEDRQAVVGDDEERAAQFERLAGDLKNMIEIPAGS